MTLKTQRSRRTKVRQHFAAKIIQRAARKRWGWPPRSKASNLVATNQNLAPNLTSYACLLQRVVRGHLVRLVLHGFLVYVSVYVSMYVCVRVLIMYIYIYIYIYIVCICICIYYISSHYTYSVI